MITRQGGFTLIEVVLASSLFILILFVSYGVLDFSIRSFANLEQKVDQQQNLRIAMEAITQDLRKSPKILARASNVGGDQKNLLLKTKEGDVVWYYLNGNTLRWSKMLKGTNVFYAHNPVADGILELKFFYNATPLEDSNQVTVFLRGRDESGNSVKYQTTVQLKLK